MLETKDNVNLHDKVHQWVEDNLTCFQSDIQQVEQSDSQQATGDVRGKTGREKSYALKTRPPLTFFHLIDNYRTTQSNILKQHTFHFC